MLSACGVAHELTQARLDLVPVEALAAGIVRHCGLCGLGGFPPRLALQVSLVVVVKLLESQVGVVSGLLQCDQFGWEPCGGVGHLLVAVCV